MGFFQALLDPDLVQQFQDGPFGNRGAGASNRTLAAYMLNLNPASSRRGFPG
jgi:hypothetical protein